NYLQPVKDHCVCLVPLHQHFYPIFVGNAFALYENRLAYDSSSTRFRRLANGRAIIGTEPVKLIPANSVELVTTLPNVGPSAGTKLTTPSGTPASLIILNISQLDSIAVSAGFHKTALPIRAGV
uniref:Uncharacterized protein n=1 Tax=Glossina palpalis gambiensis TaxID=67801 RepID=A0A1B0BYD0_9MUSC